MRVYNYNSAGQTVSAIRSIDLIIHEPNHLMFHVLSGMRVARVAEHGTDKCRRSLGMRIAQSASVRDKSKEGAKEEIASLA